MSEQDAMELIGDYQDEQMDLDTVSKLEHREDHSVLEAELVKGEPLYPHELTRGSSESVHHGSFLLLVSICSSSLTWSCGPNRRYCFPTAIA